jgi:hypothetical protein
MVRHFETDLRVLEIQCAASWSLADHIVFLGTQLMLYIIALSADEGKQTSSPSSWVVSVIARRSAWFRRLLQWKASGCLRPSAFIRLFWTRSASSYY